MYSDRHQPYTKPVTARRSRQYTTEARVPAQVQQQAPDVEEDDDKYYIPMQTQAPRSARRYDTEGNEVVVQNGRRYVMHQEPPPARQRPRRQNHWLLFIGCGMLVMILLYVAASWAVSAWQEHQLDAQYGMPRTFQVDQVVGHNNDSASHPSHFIFENLHGRVVIIELPAGDISKAIIYGGPTLIQENAGDIPVTGEFRDMNNDGKIDMVVHIEEQTIIYINNGTKFVPQQP